MGHLAGSSGQQRLFRAAARHGTGTQVRNEAPSAEDGRVARGDGVHVHQARKALGHFLCQRTGKSRRSRGTGLTCRQQQDGHTATHRHFKATASVGRKLHGRHDEAVRLTDERALTPLVFTAGNIVEHLERSFDVLRHDPAATHVLRGGRHCCIAGVEVHLERIGDVARHYGTLEEVDVFHAVDDAADVVQVLNGGFAVSTVDIHHVHGRASGTVVGPLAPGLEVEARVLRVQLEVAPGLGEGVFHQRAREQQAARVRESAASLGQQLDTGLRRVCQADLFQQAQGRLVDLLDIAIGKRLVAAALHARVHGAQMVRKGRGAGSATGIASRRTAGSGGCVAHAARLAQALAVKRKNNSPCRKILWR